MSRDSTRLLLEIAAICVLVAWAVAAFGQERTPPRPLLDGSLSGRDNYEAYCASCHGTSGRGNGPIAAELLTPPADLTTLARRSGGTFPREQVVGYVEGTGRAIPAHGPTSMPVWGPIFRIFEADARARTRIANLAAYIESLQRRE
jgi:mono/diheme cytochrome c family protein